MQFHLGRSPLRFRVPPLAVAALCCLIWTGSSATGADPEVVSAQEAGRHVGERVTVCGNVVDTAYLEHLAGAPTFLNLERPYPNSVFTVVIWGQNRSAFRQSPHRLFLDKKVCVTGVVQTYQGQPQIEVRHPSEIEVMDPGLDADRLDPAERAVIQATLVSLGYGTGPPGDWTGDTDRALAAFRADRGLIDAETGWPETLRALAEQASNLTGEQSVAIVRLLLLHLAQRETPAAGE